MTHNRVGWKNFSDEEKERRMNLVAKELLRDYDKGNPIIFKVESKATILERIDKTIDRMVNISGDSKQLIKSIIEESFNEGYKLGSSTKPKTK